MNKAFCYILFLGFFCLHHVAFSQFYNGSHQSFGKNRVQYKTFLWQYYEQEKFDVYFYPGGKPMAEYTIDKAKEILEELEKFFDYPIDDKVQFMLYSTQSDFKQSNIGINVDEEQNVGGSTRIIGTKIFLYYEGSYVALEKQIRAGVAELIIQKMMFGKDWKEVIKNTTLLSLPEWYVNGLISYVSFKWNALASSRIKDGIESGSFQKFNQLYGTEAQYAGHAIWNYIGEVYGDAVIPNILYLTRISKNVENGFLFVIGVSLKSLSEDYLTYYQNKFETDKINRSEPTFPALEIKSKKERIYGQFKMSPDRRFYSFTTNEIGRYKIHLYDVLKDKKRVIHRGGFRIERIQDLSYPILDWHPESNELAFITEDKGKIWFNRYSIADKKTTTKEIFGLQKVMFIDYSEDGKNLVFSAVRSGQSDLFWYYVLGNRQEQLTNDIFDDLYPRVVDNGKAILFSSNRSNDTLGMYNSFSFMQDYTDLFRLPLTKDKTGVLQRITNTPRYNETHANPTSELTYSYLSDQTGLLNRFTSKFDSTIASVDTVINYRYFVKSNALTNYARNVLEYDVANSDGDYTMMMLQDGKYRFYVDNISNDEVISIQNLKLKGARNVRTFNFDEIGSPPSTDDDDGENDDPDEPTSPKATPESSFEIIKVKPIEENKEVDINNYQFKNEEKLKDSSTISTTKGSSVPVFKKLKPPRIYHVNYTTDYVTSQVDNSYTNDFYQIYSGPETVNPGIGGLIKLGTSDLFDDYKIMGGFRLSGSLDNNNYLFTYHDLSKRLDKSYSFQRQSARALIGFSLFKIQTHNFRYQLSWPLSEVTSFRGTASYRYDRAVVLSTDGFNLRQPDFTDNKTGFKLEYVFDNTIERGLNIRLGTRYKVFGETYLTPKKENSDFSVVGFDFRHYERIHKTIIAAFRVAGSTSFGSERLVYYLGGVDNWLFAKQDNAPVATDQSYGFQTLASPMRGFFNNSRNGTSFMVVNAEIRVPVFKYLAKTPIKNDFVQNFQFVAFGDMGSAWTGANPYSNNESFTRNTFEQNPIIVQIDNNREPIVFGYGFGLRSKLLGYFVRADWAWGIDDGIILPRVFYLSLSTDF